MLISLTGWHSARADKSAEPATTKPATTQAAPEGVFEDDSTPKTSAVPFERPPGPLKVGVIISKFTATGPNWGGAPYGYTHANIAKALAVDGIELHAIVEPESEGDAALVAALAENFPADVPLLDGHDEEVLKTLDVIVGQRIANMQDEMVAAIHGAVNAGTGLFIAQTFGTVTPGYRDEVCDLFGMESAAYAFNAVPLACDVQAADPLLEGTEDAGVDWQAQPSGTAGILREGVTQLVAISDVSAVQFRRNQDPEFQLPLLYFTHHGKGGIVVSNFKDLPEPLLNLTGDPFFVRCVKRAAALRPQ
ncbi:MAG: hypothetical protein H0T11_08750 [Chthoniobacterales bacterium]|nr:hypothetical protein [Chthoniobacterales bacterium]